MYRLLSDFITDFQEDSAEMARNFSQLTDSALDVRASAGGFTLGELALQLINAWPGALAQAGEPLQFAEVPAGASAAQITAGWELLREILPAQLQATWSAAKLAEPVDMWGMPWTKAKVLWEMMKHTVHHHGQLTVLLRLAGLPVHGIYGPSREEAAAMGAN